MVDDKNSGKRAQAEEERINKIRVKAEAEVGERKRILQDIRWVQGLLLEFDDDSVSNQQKVSLSKEYLSPDFYDDVTAEKASMGCCGYYSCSNELDSARQLTGDCYKIVDHRASNDANGYVIHGEEYSKFCSKSCFRKSAAFRASLLPDAPYMRDVHRLKQLRCQMAGGEEPTKRVTLVKPVEKKPVETKPVEESPASVSKPKVVEKKEEVPSPASVSKPIEDDASDIDEPPEMIPLDKGTAVQPINRIRPAERFNIREVLPPSKNRIVGPWQEPDEVVPPPVVKPVKTEEEAPMGGWQEFANALKGLDNRWTSNQPFPYTSAPTTPATSSVPKRRTQPLTTQAKINPSNTNTSLTNQKLAEMKTLKNEQKAALSLLETETNFQNQLDNLVAQKMSAPPPKVDPPPPKVVCQPCNVDKENIPTPQQEQPNMKDFMDSDDDEADDDLNKFNKPVLSPWMDAWRLLSMWVNDNTLALLEQFDNHGFMNTIVTSNDDTTTAGSEEEDTGGRMPAHEPAEQSVRVLIDKLLAHLPRVVAHTADTVQVNNLVRSFTVLGVPDCSKDVWELLALLIVYRIRTPEEKEIEPALHSMYILH